MDTMQELIIYMDGRELAIDVEKTDSIYFRYYDNNEGDQNTKKLSIEEFYDVLHSIGSWNEKLKREQTDAEIKGWMDRCVKLEKEQETLKQEKYILQGQVKSLAETIILVSEK